MLWFEGSANIAPPKLHAKGLLKLPQDQLARDSLARLILLDDLGLLTDLCGKVLLRQALGLASRSDGFGDGCVDGGHFEGLCVLGNLGHVQVTCCMPVTGCMGYNGNAVKRGDATLPYSF